MEEIHYKLPQLSNKSKLFELLAYVIPYPHAAIYNQEYMKGRGSVLNRILPHVTTVCTVHDLYNDIQVWRSHWNVNITYKLSASAMCIVHSTAWCGSVAHAHTA